MEVYKNWMPYQNSNLQLVSSRGESREANQHEAEGGKQRTARHLWLSNEKTERNVVGRQAKKLAPKKHAITI